MIETMIVLLCALLPDYEFREAPDIAQYANELRITHFPDELSFDVKDLYKTDGSNCYWVSITPY